MNIQSGVFENFANRPKDISENLLLSLTFDVSRRTLRTPYARVRVLFGVGVDLILIRRASSPYARARPSTSRLRCPLVRPPSRRERTFHIHFGASCNNRSSPASRPSTPSPTFAARSPAVPPRPTSRRLALPRATVRRPRVPRHGHGLLHHHPRDPSQASERIGHFSGALEGVEGEPVTLTEQAAYLIGASFIDWLVTKTGKPAVDLTVAVGRDPRLSGRRSPTPCSRVSPPRVAAASSTWASPPLPPVSCPPSPPPPDYDAGIMLTASHLPSIATAPKFSPPPAGWTRATFPRHLRRSRRRVRSHPPRALTSPSSNPDGSTSVSGVEHRPFIEEYASQLRHLIVKGVGMGPKPLEGMRIAVDAGNGSRGFFAASVLEPPADVAGSQFLDPDGNFPNHSP